MSKYPDSGALFTSKDKKSERSPDYDGNLEIGPDTLRYLVQQAKASKDTTIRIAGWKKQGKTGTTFLSLKLSVPQERDEGKPQKSQSSYDDEIPF